MDDPADPSARSGTSDPADATHSAEALDPVLARRRRIARGAELGQRVGYLLFGLAVVLFVVAMATGLPGALITAIVIAMAVGSLLLAPSIVVGYGVKAADREDRERAAAKKQRGNAST